MEANLIASSGTLISASLESAGYYYQSFVLDALNAPFASSAGALVYSVGVVAAIIVFFISGEVKNTFWLVVAPGLFLSCVIIRTPTTGSRWIFGEEERDQEKVAKQVSYIISKATGGTVSADTYEASISSLFAGYNKVISSTANEFIRLINGDRLNADIVFIVRDQLFAAMNFSMVHDRGFIDLLHAGFIDNCGMLLTNGQTMVDPLAEPCSRCKSAANYNKMIGQPYMLTSAALDYVATLYVDYPTLAAQAASTGFADQTCVSNLVVSTCGGDTNYSCGSGLSFGTEDYSICSTAAAVVPNIATGLCTTYATRSSTLAAILTSTLTAGNLMTNSIVSDAEEKFVEQRRLLDSASYTCPQIWAFTYLGVHRHALEVYNYAISVWEKLNGRLDILGWCSAGFDASTNEVFKLFGPWVGTDDPILSLSQVARRLMRSELQKGSVAALAANTVNQHGTVSGVGVPTESELSMVERARNADPAWAERSRLLVSATTLPYYQGLGLFFLAIAFPFFAMLLLVPGKHAGFFLWFGLWAWLKSWDVAYSIVMLLSDALYSLFILNVQDTLSMDFVNIFGASIMTLHQNVFMLGVHPEMAVTMYGMKQPDPNYNLTTYYHIIAICLLSIPSITGYMILGAFKGGQGLVSQGSSMIPVTPKTIYEGVRGKEQLIEMYESKSSSSSSSGTESPQSSNNPSGNSSSTSSTSGSAPSLATQAIAQGARSRPGQPTSQPTSDSEAIQTVQRQQPPRSRTNQEAEARPLPGLPSPQSRQVITPQSAQNEPVYLDAPKENTKVTVTFRERAGTGWNDQD